MNAGIITSETYIGVLQRENIVISMDGRGEYLVIFSLKVSGEVSNYEGVSLKGYSAIVGLSLGLDDYFCVYIGGRPYQALRQ